MIEARLNLRNDLLVPTMTTAQPEADAKRESICSHDSAVQQRQLTALAPDRALKAGGIVGGVVTADMIRTYCAADTLQSGRKEVT